MPPISPRNKIIVSIDKKFQDEIKTESGITFYKDTSFNPEWNVTVTGTVESIPHKLTVPGMKSEVMVGDELAFGYWVIHDKKPRPEHEEAFYEDTQAGDRNKHYSNSRKEVLQLRYLNRRMMIGLYMDRHEQLIAGYNGTPLEVEHWATQNFRFTNPEDMVYSNLLWYADQDYWLVDCQETIAVRRQGEVIPINGYVLLAPQKEKMVYEMDHNSHLHLIGKTEYGSSTIISIGEPFTNSPNLGLKPGDTVKFNQKYIEKYELWGTNYLLLKQDRILGSV